MNYQNKVILQSELSIKHAFIMRKKKQEEREYLPRLFLYDMVG